MDKNFKNLKKQLARNRASLVQLFSVPSLEKMGMAFSFEGISAALGRDVAPVMPPEAIRLLDVEARANSVAAMETFYATMRADFGLTRPGELIGYMLDLLHEPIEKKLKLKKQDKGGRTPNVYKRFMIETLALAAPRVLCPDANDPTDRRIIDFNVFVMPRCGFTEAGIDKATADCLRKKKSLKKKVGEIVGRS